MAGASPASSAASLPGFTLPDLAGVPQTSSAWLGQPVLLDFWATWCVACRHTHPGINRLHAEYGAQGLRVIGINLDRGDRDKVLAYREKMNLAYPVLLDPEDTVSPRFGVETLPTVILFDREGKAVGTWVGGERSQEEALRAAVRKMMGDG